MVGPTGEIQAVVACAGTDACGALGDVPAATWERVLLVNLLGTAAVVRAALPFLEQQGRQLLHRPVRPRLECGAQPGHAARSWARASFRICLIDLARSREMHI
jgi:NAD(P)-dependent dehydrogenase (short-subunit alcohol dehydrogenase family)